MGRPSDQSLIEIVEINIRLVRVYVCIGRIPKIPVKSWIEVRNASASPRTRLSPHSTPMTIEYEMVTGLLGRPAGCTGVSTSCKCPPGDAM